MARQRAPVQVNQFVGGLNTEANPLNFPPNASIDEQNMDILLDGSRRRRRGFGAEAGYDKVNTGISTVSGSVMGRGQFSWDNPGGIPSAQFVVVQLGNYVGIHDLNETTLSTNRVHSITLPTSTYGINFGMASVDGLLVIVTGEKDIHVVEYDGTTFTDSTHRLRVRDLFGVVATGDGETLTDAQNLSYRPSVLNDEHLYNLRNQTFGLPRVNGHINNTDLKDPIGEFFTESGDTVYPANSDNVAEFLLADANMSTNRTVERFKSEDMWKNQSGNTHAPMGHYIIDALDRGTSRLEQEAETQANNPDLTTYAVTTLPDDSTPGGATVVAQYAGRVWYAGFSGRVSDGDARSPNLASYIMFTQVVSDTGQVGNCFQAADPTSHIDSSIVEDDGGAIKIAGCYGIKKMVALDASLFVFAENGVWRVIGADGDSFRATGYSVEKLSNHGCVAGGSVVTDESVVMYWGESDIFAVSKTEYGDWVVTNVSEPSIKSLYADISTVYRATCSGYFDPTDLTVRWIFGTLVDGYTEVSELVFSLKYKAFTKNVIPLEEGVAGPITVGGGQYLLTENTLPVTVSGVTVTVGGVEVFIQSSDYVRDVDRSLYCILVADDPIVTYTFGGYLETGVEDWQQFGPGIDSPAFITTGSLTAGDGRLRKDVPYVTVYMQQTEEADQTGLESSCYLNAQWNWTTDYGAGKWSNARQVYRRSRFDSGDKLVVTRNKIRGHGRSVALNFASEEGKDMHIYGWDFNIAAGVNE